MKTSDAVILIFSIAICQLAGVIGSMFTAPGLQDWYATLEKPAFNPPSWLFAPVWLILFTLMGVSLYLVLKEGFDDRRVKLGVSAFSVQLILNASWSYLFFGIREPFYAFIEILVLLVAILLTISSFWKINRKASYLLVPYVLWVSFAALVNFSIWRLNI